MNSILESIKKPLGIAIDETSFDVDILMHINSAILGLTQIGVGPSTGFFVESKDVLWEEFVSQEKTYAGAVKTYIFGKVKLAFDPPQSSAVLEALERQIKEAEWRISVAAEGGQV